MNVLCIIDVKNVEAQLPLLVCGIDHIVMTQSVVRIKMTKPPILLVDHVSFSVKPSWMVYSFHFVGVLEVFQKFLYLVVLIVELPISLKGSSVK